MKTKTTKTPGQLAAEAKKTELLAKVYTPEQLVREAADWWTTENLGQDYFGTGRFGGRTHWRTMEIDLSEEDREDGERGLNEEFRSWERHAKKVLKLVVKAKLPLTLASMDALFAKVSAK